MHDVCHYADDRYMFEGSIEYDTFHVQRTAEAKIQTKTDIRANGKEQFC